jgi:hypothetical protein
MKNETKKTMVDGAKFESLVRELELPMLNQAGFVKVCHNGNCVYIANTKAVGRIDISGFEMSEDTAGIVRLGGEAFGRVKQQVEFVGRTEDEILATTRAILEHLKTLPPVEKAKRGASSTTPKEKAKGFSADVPKAPPVDKAARRALIEKVAKEKGAKVSKKTEEELAPAPDAAGA